MPYQVTTARLDDADGDGLPDVWELAHGLNPNDPSDAALDQDGDGSSNLHEFLAGTNPRDPESALRITLVQPLPQGYRIEWRGGSKTGQTLQRALRLHGSNTVWNDLFTTNLLESHTGSYIDPDTGGIQFYRVRLQP